jgi:hypothetical protein
MHNLRVRGIRPKQLRELTEDCVSEPERAALAGIAGLSTVGHGRQDHADMLTRTDLELDELAAIYDETDTGLEAAS